MSEATPEQAPKTTRYIPQASDHIYKANIEALAKDEGAKGATKFFYMLENVPDNPIPIEDAIKVNGLKNPTYLVIIGFATRKVLESARKQDKHIENIVVIEPDLSHFKQAIKREYIGDLVKDPSVEFIIGMPMEELSYALFKHFAKSSKAGGTNAAKCAYPEIITDPFVYQDEQGKKTVQTMIDMVVETKNQLFTSMGCAADTFNRHENTVRNIENIKSRYEIKSLFGKFGDVPAIVLGAGPSLDDFVKAYHEYNLRDKAVIIACDAALRKLLKHDIRPHLVTRCERKLTTIFDGVERENTKGIYYVAYPWTAPEYFDLFDDAFMVFRNNGASKLTGYDPGNIDGGVSAANAGLELAYLMGCKTVFLSGVDLCFIDGKSHTTDTEVEFDPEKSKAKWTKITSNDGTEQTTIPVWKRCLKEYEHSFFRNAAKGVTVYNTSPKGARLATTVFKTWEQLRHELGDRKYPRKVIEANLTKPGIALWDGYIKKKSEAIELLGNANHDLTKLFLFLDDAMTNSAREERKVIDQFRSTFEPYQFFTTVKQVEENLKKMYHEPCRQIDEWKSKYFGNQIFADTILDMCQHDLFQAENKAYSLKNLFHTEHTRQIHYIAIHAALLREMKFYIELMHDMLSKGPDAVKYDHAPSLGAFDKSFAELYGYS